MAHADSSGVGLACFGLAAEITSAALGCFAEKASHFVFFLRCGGRQALCYNNSGGSSARLALLSAFAWKTIGRDEALSRFGLQKRATGTIGVVVIDLPCQMRRRVASLSHGLPLQVFSLWLFLLLRYLCLCNRQKPVHARMLSEAANPQVLTRLSQLLRASQPYNQHTAPEMSVMQIRVAIVFVLLILGRCS